MIIFRIEFDPLIEELVIRIAGSYWKSDLTSQQGASLKGWLKQSCFRMLAVNHSDDNWPPLLLISLALALPAIWLH
jgi:hypothetical protein